MEPSSFLNAAGLYDSIPAVPLELATLETAAEGLFWDAELRDDLLNKIAEAGRQVESALGGEPQDVEGVFSDGEITVVQARPQVF